MAKRFDREAASGLVGDITVSENALGRGRADSRDQVSRERNVGDDVAGRHVYAVRQPNRQTPFPEGQSAVLKALAEGPEIGAVMEAGYDRFLVATNDAWKGAAGGVPLNAFLIAHAYDANNPASSPDRDREAVVLRVRGKATLPGAQEDGPQKVDRYRRLADGDAYGEGMDPLTRGQLQFHGLDCKVLGTMHADADAPEFAPDVEDFAVMPDMAVRKPSPAALAMIVNYVDPARRAKADEEARARGMSAAAAAVRVGRLRMSSSSRRAKLESRDGGDVPVLMHPSDLLAKRTAMLGMTRTGKSNMLKTVVSAIALASSPAPRPDVDRSGGAPHVEIPPEGLRDPRSDGFPIGQIIYDLNGEYANTNQQDKGSINEAFSDVTIRYTAGDLKPGDEEKGIRSMKVDFYSDPETGFQIVAGELAQQTGGVGKSQDIQTFLTLDFEPPAPEADKSDKNRHAVKLALWRTMLSTAGFERKAGGRIEIPFGKKSLENLGKALTTQAGGDALSARDEEFRATVEELVSAAPKERHLDYEAAEAFFKKVRELDVDDQTGPLKNGDGNRLIDADCSCMLNMIAQRNAQNGPFNGWRVLLPFKRYHSLQASANIALEVYRELVAGRIVILDLYSGNPVIRRNMSEVIATYIREENQRLLTENVMPPAIMMYLEEAHNVIGKDDPLDATWPRIAKEGAKAGIGLVYATQRPSSVNASIMSETENIIVTKLNNTEDVRALGKLYDFEDFSKEIREVQTPGFARVKTLSSAFVMPVQIDEFKPDEVSEAHLSRRGKR